MGARTQNHLGEPYKTLHCTEPRQQDTKSRVRRRNRTPRGHFIGHYHNIRYMRIAGNPQARVPVRTLYGLPLLCTP